MSAFSLEGCTKLAEEVAYAAIQAIHAGAGNEGSGSDPASDERIVGLDTSS